MGDVSRFELITPNSKIYEILKVITSGSDTRQTDKPPDRHTNLQTDGHRHAN